MDKVKIVQILDNMPADVDVEKFVEKLRLLEKLEVAERQLRAGQGVPHEEVKRRHAPYLT